MLAQRAAEASNRVRLPQTLDALCRMLGVEVPEHAVFFPSSTMGVSQPVQLTRSIKMLCPDSEARQAECVKQVELQYDEAQYYRDRFDDRAQRGLIADGQILDSLAKLEPEKARAIGRKSPEVFVKEFTAHIKGVGPFVALKVASPAAGRVPAGGRYPCARSDAWRLLRPPRGDRRRAPRRGDR